MATIPIELKGALIIGIVFLGLGCFHVPPPAIDVSDLRVDPSKFKTSEQGKLTVPIKNNRADRSVAFQIEFQTAQNVQMFIGTTPLQKRGDNYIYQQSLDPEQRTELVFSLKASLRSGERSTTYEIKASFNIEGKIVSEKTTQFTVEA